jgi:isopentenyl-diphosphate delta-isomerase
MDVTDLIGPGPPEADDVVLLDEDGQPTGRAPRAQVHTTRTPLHLAFSCYLLRRDGELLLTRRALTKRTWPGVWSNSFCGHPRPGEPLEHAVRRYARRELGMTLTGLRCVLPSFRYRAVDPSGTVENEVCPVFVATSDDEPAPVADEVMDHTWVSSGDLTRLVSGVPRLVSPWMVEQLGAMPGLTTLNVDEGLTR